MLIEAQSSITIRLPDGPRQLSPGDRVELPEDKGRKLLDLAQDKVRMVSIPAFTPGDRVAYRTPHPIRSGTDYDWSEHIGIVELIDHNQEMILVIPESADQPWRWIAECYVSEASQ